MFEQREFDLKKIKFYNRIALLLLGFAIIFNLGAFALTTYGLGLEGVVEANPIPAFLYKVGGPVVMFLVMVAAWICTAKFVHFHRFACKHSVFLPDVAFVVCGLDFAWDVGFLAGAI